MRIKIVAKNHGVAKSYILSIPAHVKRISDLKAHIASRVDLEPNDEDSFELHLQGAELLSSEKVSDVIREDDTVEVLHTYHPKKRAGAEKSEEDRELDHLFLTNLEDIIILRDHYKTMKRIKGDGNQSIPVKVDQPERSRKVIRSKRELIPGPEDEETDPEQETRLKKATTIQTQKTKPQQAKKQLSPKMQESESSEGENEDKTTPKPLAKKVAENAATQKAQVQLKKPDPSKKVILNIQDPEQEYLEKKSQWMQLESVRNKTAKEIQKKPAQTAPKKNIIQKKPANLPQSPSNIASKQEKTPQKPNPNILQGSAIAFQPQKKTEEAKSLPLPKQAKPIQIGGAPSNFNSTQSSITTEKPQPAQAKPLPQNTPQQINRFNLDKFVEIPPAVLIHMHKKGKQSLYKLGDTVLYKCTELDQRTFSPTVSAYKIARIQEIKGDRLVLRVIISDSVPKAPVEREEGEESSGEEEEDTNPTLQLHNFVEFHIDKASLNVQRIEAIKTSLTEFKEELQKNTAQKARGGATDSAVADEQKAPETEEDRKQTVLKRIGRQMNYYFSDKNYLKDDFIKGLEAKDPERYLEIKAFMNFPRIQQICSGVPQLTEALLYQLETVPNSEFELNEDKTKIRKRLSTGAKSTTGNESQEKLADKIENIEPAV